jgi:hypothetical protein
MERFELPNPNRDCMPRFYMKPVKNEYESEKQGRDIYADTEYVEIIIPGDKYNIVNERVKDEHRNRWATQYAAFKAGQEAPLEGTPIEEWAPISASQALELKSVHVRTVEQLAGLSDSQLAKAVPMGGFALREKAQGWLKQASDAQPLAEAMQQINALQAQLDELKRQKEEAA